MIEGVNYDLFAIAPRGTEFLLRAETATPLFVASEQVWLPDFDIAFYAVSDEERSLLASFQNPGDEGGTIPAGATHAMVTLQMGPGRHSVVVHKSPESKYTFIEACIK